MFLKRFIHLISIIIFVTFHSHGYAAETKQTIEGAQEFLQKVLPGVQYKSGGLEDALAKVNREDKRNGYHEGLGKIIESKHLAKCQSTLLFDYSNVKYVSSGVISSMADMPESMKREGGQNGFSWGELLETRLEGAKVYVTFRGHSPSIIYLGAESLAKRVAYAIEFLRLQCDESVNTGF